MIEIRREKFSKIYFSKKRPHKKSAVFFIIPKKLLKKN
ncbi:hypothetical protein LEP1GSC103_0218 [Leptospira borgpetersenii serovar Javanica str. UI 09931]|uniref:SLEI domain protein, PF07620 family n=2 Tax=Leptospira borgpetersenii TaxID=174 RepID=A0AAV3JG28_LEPBO|nr:hypothetical protein LEP1GSC101_2620 [Leptospira borgpetersenii str. UI 09149]EMK10557.1 hypothetical protein LEP1GSC066_0405 [Leptospira sp. serovar Kenya str. Sh9]EMN14704.1 hypothetical protein LEP1GSC055_0260 [Leptospira borgpetersenii str. Brem 307]EMN18377.1 hypothetical protein LEP1GSC056_0642 [Leptospira borgpetersenii str. Brem 328]EMN58237.1 hypothetical protein LEP1GSC090_3925 [Leptospira borgpetersenii serovar Javanica str. MK146]EPG58996.1 hypothetical protein LEP1GSC103_0218 [